MKKLIKLLFILIIALSSYVLLFIPLEDGSNIYPSWLEDYRIFLVFIWVVIICFILIYMW